MHGFAAILVFSLFSAGALLPAASVKKVAPKLGIKTPGVQIPFESLKSLAEIPLSDKPGAIFINDALWIVEPGKDSLVKIDAKTNKPGDPLVGFHKPCSGVANGFSSLLIPNCGDGSLVRYDLKSKKISATLPVGVASVRTGVTASADSIWLITDEKTTLSRIDPDTNKVVSELRIPSGCDSVLFAETALWVTCPAEGKVLRIDPETNLVVNRIDVSAKPHAMVAGENFIWVLCLGEGKVARIDPKTNKVTKTIDLEVPNADGNLAFGEGFLWVTLTGFPLTRIDTTTEKVAQQFTGEGGGAVYVGLGSVWLVNTAENKLLRIDPKRVLATLAE